MEKVEIVLFQQIAGPVAVPAPAPAPAPQLAQQIVGLPVTSLPGVVPVAAPAPAPPSRAATLPTIIGSVLGAFFGTGAGSFPFYVASLELSQAIEKAVIGQMLSGS